MTKLYLYVCRYLTVFLLCGATVAFAQEKKVTGKVTSADDGSAVPGVNVLEKGTANGTVTDADGNYTISVGGNATLVFSFVGFKAQEIAVGDQTTVNAALTADVTALSEVVVVGYGSQEKKELTGAVTSLKSESFNRGNINDPTQLLQGKIAGVTISKPGNDPNESFVIRLRGVTSANGVQPLVVIDGVIGASLQNVDPNDIATFDVLKDASSAAIYGSRGAAGVILITTKKGKSGKSNIDYNGFVAVDEIAKSVPVMSREQYLGVGGQDLGSNTNWIKQITRTGVTKVQNLSLSGGSGSTSYRVSVNYRNVNGILRKSGFDQLNTRINLQQGAWNNRIRASLDMAATTRKSNYSFQEALRYAAIYNPTAPVFETDPASNPYGSPYFERALFDNFNPVGIIDQNVNEGKKNTINLGGKVEVDIISGLTGVVSASMQRESEITGQYYSKHANFRGFNRDGLATRTSNSTEFQLIESYLTYTKRFGDVNVTATAGHSYQIYTAEGFGMTAGDFLSDALGYNNMGSSIDLTKSGIVSLYSYADPDNKIRAFFGRANLNYKDTYYLSGSIRNEGSSRFGPANQVGNFPAVSGAVVLSNLFSVPQINQLKLRVGFGKTGALPPAAGLSPQTYSPGSGYWYDQGGQVATAVPYSSNNLASSISPNPNLKWEAGQQLNAGIDFGLLNNKLTGTIDVYNKIASNFILLRPGIAGIDPGQNKFQNLGEVQTKGLEFSASYNVISKGDFTWTTRVVAHTYKSILNSYPGTEGKSNGLPDLGAGLGAPGQNNTYPVSIIAGQRVGVIYGPKFSGQVDSNGSPLMVAADGSLVLATDPKITSRDGHVVLGYGLPTLDLGWTNSFTYKNFDLNIFLRGNFGHSLVNSWRAFYEPIVPGQINSYNRVTTKYSRSDIKDAKFSSYYVEKADFLKLDNVTLGYNIKLGGNIPLTKARVYVSGNNLFVITSYTGVDPEARLEDKASSDNGGFTATNTDPLAPGIDRRSNYFRARTITVGVNLTF